jgi:hypothetical protein
VEVAPASQICAPRTSIYHRWKGRLEKWFVSEEPDAVPLGQSVYQTFSNQVDQGIAARMILNDFDFEAGSANLNRRGQDKLPQVAALALRYPYFVIVERTDYSPALAELRKQAVLKELARQSIPLPADRVVVGLPRTPGLSGVEAFYLYENLLNQTKSGGMQPGGASAESTTTGGTQPTVISPTNR